MPHEEIYFAALRRKLYHEHDRTSTNLAPEREQPTLSARAGSRHLVEILSPYRFLSEDTGGDLNKEGSESNNNETTPSIPPSDEEVPATVPSTTAPVDSDPSYNNDTIGPVAPEGNTTIPSNATTPAWPFESPTKVFNLAVGWSLQHEVLATVILLPIVLVVFLFMRSVNKCYKNIHERRERHDFDKRSQQANQLLGELQMVPHDEQDDEYF